MNEDFLCVDDVLLCLVTNDVLRGLTNVPFIRDRYSLSDLDGRTFNSWYGVILLVANDLPVCRLSLVDFPHSQMGRRLILVDLSFSSGRLLRIGTVHLESLNNAEQRSEQLKICEKEFSRLSGDFILMGDFNFSDRSKENDDQFRLLSGWKDLWNSLKSDKDDNRFTFDTETNRMTKLSNGAIDRSRYDRIILKGERITPKEIDILGRDPIGNHEDLQIFASDHYGLTALVEKIEFL